MIDWHKVHPKDFNAEMENARAASYYNVFYSTEEGRAVLFDMVREADKRNCSAETVLALKDFMVMVAEKSGARDYEAVIAAEAEVAKHFEVVEKKERTELL